MPKQSAEYAYTGTPKGRVQCTRQSGVLELLVSPYGITCRYISRNESTRFPPLKRGPVDKHIYRRRATNSYVERAFRNAVELDTLNSSKGLTTNEIARESAAIAPLHKQPAPLLRVF